MSEVKQIKRVAKIFTGTTPPTNNEEYYSSDDVDWYTPSDFSYESVNVGHSEKKISKKYFSETKASLYCKGCVAIVCIGTIGKVGYVNHSFYTNQQINVLQFNKEIFPKYGAYFLNTQKNLLTTIAPSVTLPILNQARLGDLWISYPSLEVQQRIVSYLDDKTAKIDKAVSLLQKKRDAYTRLKTSIINRAVTRGLNTNVKLKDSGVDWIGMIPEGWKISLLKHACNGITDGSHFSPESIYGDGKPYITVSNVRNDVIDINGASRISDKDFDILAKNGCQPKVGDILLSKDGTVGRTAIVTNNNFVVLSSLGIISPSKNLTSKFLKYMLDSRLLQNQMEVMMAGAALKRITIFKIENLLCVVPSIQEQQAIASYLDTHCSRIDHAISIVDKQIDAYTRLKKSLINEVVTGKRKC